MSNRVILDEPYIKEVMSEVGSGIEIPAAAAGVDGSILIVSAEAELGYRAFISQLANIIDDPDAAPYVYFKFKIAGTWASDPPLNKFATSLGVPNQPGSFKYKIPEGAKVELWGFNSDAAAWKATGYFVLGMERHR